MASNFSIFTRLKKNRTIYLIGISGLILITITILALLTKLLIDNSLNSNPINSDFASNDQIARDIIQNCEESTDWQICYGQKLNELVKKHDIIYTLQILKRLEAIEYKTNECHLLAHYIASGQVEKKPNDWLSVFDYVDLTTCTGGYIHGVIEGRSKFDPSFALDEETIPKMCISIRERSKGYKNTDAACAHVSGHVLLASKNGSVLQSSEVCNKIPFHFLYSCFSGVFMENILRDNLVAHEISTKIPLDEEFAKKLEILCRTYTDTPEKSCWREMAHIYMALGKRDPKSVYAFCSRAKEAELIDECYLHTVEILVTNTSFPKSKFQDICAPYGQETNNMKQCMKRIVLFMLSSTKNLKGRAGQFCEANPDAYEKSCFDYISSSFENTNTINSHFAEGEEII